MLVTWLIGFIINLIVLYLWYHSYEDEERIPINIILFIILILLGLTPILNLISGIILLALLISFYSEDWLEFHGPKWMNKTIK